MIVNASNIEAYIPLSESPPYEEVPLTKIKGSSYEKGFLKAKAVIIQHNNALKHKEEG